MSYDNNRTRRPRRKKNHNFEASEALAKVWGELRGYGVWTHDRQGHPFDWATSRKQCNLKLQEVQRSFNLSQLNATRSALLKVEDLYNGRLENTALRPIDLRNEINRVQMVRTMLLTSRCETEEEFIDLRDELDEMHWRDLREERGRVRDRLWREDRAALAARIKKTVAKGKKKGKIKSVKAKTKGRNQKTYA